MSRKALSGQARLRRARADVFAALGDETRLALVAKLSDGQRYSISQLAQFASTPAARPAAKPCAGLTRQAITKHLRVLEGAGMVRCARAGRESLFELDPKPFAEMKEYLEFVSTQWDDALARLKLFVEE